MNKLTIIFLIICINFSCYASQIVISLGPNCGPAMCLAYHKIRKEAYPFDWVVCDFNAMYKLLETDFENYLLPQHLVVDPNNPYFVKDVYTNVQYNHDFPITNTPKNLYNNEWRDSGGVGFIVEDFINYLAPIYEKYQRRINRFRQVLKSNHEVIFMHFGTTKVQAIALRNFIEKAYPALKFKLLIVNTGPLSVNEWNEPNIHDYKIPLISWDMSIPDYKFVMADMGFIHKF